MAGYAMNKHPLFRAATLLLAPALIALSACGATPADPNAIPEEGALVGARIGGPFTLTDHNGQRVSYSDSDGKYRMVYFGYTYCPDVCPVDLQKLMAGLALFEKQDPARAAKVQPIFITIDPERDTPEVVRNFVTAFSPRLIGLTGTRTEIDAVAKSFAVIHGKAGGTSDESYLVDHSRTPFLMGPDGKPLDLLPTDQIGTDVDEGSPEAVRRLLDVRVQ